MKTGPAPVKPGFEPRKEAPNSEIAAINEWRRRQAEYDAIRPLRFSLLDRAEKRLFDFAKLPVEPEARFLINGSPVCTPGNLTNVIAQAKAGKSAFVGAMLAAAVCAEREGDERDTLGITATAPGKRPLVHFDTEQSIFDHDQLVRRALARAGADSKPSWLQSYALAGFGADEVLEMARMVMGKAAGNDGLFGVILDGAADLVNDVNDAKECNALVAELQNLAIKYDCPIINVLHENPGGDNGKMRGHLGSQMERKAESNLRLRKGDEVTVVFSEKMRRAPIFEKDGPRFAWSNNAGMHVSVESAGEARGNSKRAELVELAVEAFEGRPSLKFTDMTVAIVKARDCTKRTAERYMKEMTRLKVITKQGFGLYVPTTVNQPTNEPT